MLTIQTKAAPKAKPASEPVKAKKPASKPASKPKAASKPASKDKAAAPAKVASKKAAKPLSKVEETKDATAAAAEEDAPATNGDAAANGDKPQKVKAPSSGGRALKLGQGLPAITLQDNTGADVDVAELAGEKGVVIFLYPRVSWLRWRVKGFSLAPSPVSSGGADSHRPTRQAARTRPAASATFTTTLPRLATTSMVCQRTSLPRSRSGLRKRSSTTSSFATRRASLSRSELVCVVRADRAGLALLFFPTSKLLSYPPVRARAHARSTKRSHFIFEKGTGALVDIALGVKPADDPTNVLKFLKAHHK